MKICASKFPGTNLNAYISCTHHPISIIFCSYELTISEKMCTKFQAIWHERSKKGCFQANRACARRAIGLEVHCRELARHDVTVDFIKPLLWPPNSPELNPVDYKVWSVLQERVHRSQIHDVEHRGGVENVQSEHRRYSSQVVASLTESLCKIRRWTLRASTLIGSVHAVNLWSH